MKKTPLRRRKPLQSRHGFAPLARPRKPYRPKAREEGDYVTPGMHSFILARDGQCMAPVLDKDLKTLCADTFGNEMVHGAYASLVKLQLDHVPEKNMTSMGDRAPSDERHLVAVCPKHHLHGWATSKRGRDLERDYLIGLYGPVNTTTS